MSVTAVTSSAEFKGYIEKEKLTVVDFFAVWCGPCKVISPVVDKLAEQYTDVEFIKVDVDKLEDVSQEVGIRAMPTFMLFRGGEKVSEIVGANPGALKSAIEKARNDCLSGKPVAPLAKSESSPAAAFINSYGRVIVILVGFLIWYFKRDATAKSGGEDSPIDL